MATRFRLPNSGAVPVTPAFQSYTHANGVRRPMPTATVGDSSALTTTAQTPDAADHIVAGDTSHWQGISDPLDVQNLSAQTIQGAIQCLESNVNNNLFIQVWIGLYDNAGSSLIATLLAKSLDGLELATTLTNRFWSFTTTAYNMVAADIGARIVVELSVRGTPVASGGVQGHNASLRFGSNGAGGDLGSNDTDTGTTLNPWLEFANDLIFQVTKPYMGKAAGILVPAVGIMGH